MKRILDQLNQLRSDALLAVFRNKSGADEPLGAFNDQENEEGSGLDYRGAVGFVTNRFNAMMTLFKWRREARDSQWAAERRFHERTTVHATLTGIPSCPHREIE